jgi:hypothetical protein
VVAEVLDTSTQVRDTDGCQVAMMLLDSGGAGEINHQTMPIITERKATKTYPFRTTEAVLHLRKKILPELVVAAGLTEQLTAQLAQLGEVVVTAPKDAFY